MYTSDVEAAKSLQHKYTELKQAIGQVIVGQHDVVEGVIISIYAMAIVCWWEYPAWPKPCW